MSGKERTASGLVSPNIVLTLIKRNTGTLVTRHFNSPNHTIENLKCVVVERVHPDKVTARKKRESFWMSKLQTLTPDGLNPREEDPWDR